MLELILRLQFGILYGTVFRESLRGLKSCGRLFFKQASSMQQVELAFGFSARVERVDVPIDYRFLDILLRAAEDTEVCLGECSRRQSGSWDRELPALYKPKKKWRLPSQVDPLDYLEYAPDRSGVWRRNYASLREFESQVLEVMHDQAARGQIIVMTECRSQITLP